MGVAGLEDEVGGQQVVVAAAAPEVAAAADGVDLLDDLAAAAAGIAAAAIALDVTEIQGENHRFHRHRPTWTCSPSSTSSYGSGTRS